MSAAAETINVQEKLSASLLPERNDSNNHLTNGAVNLFAPDCDEILDDEELNGIHETVDPRVSTYLANWFVCFCSSHLHLYHYCTLSLYSL